MSHLSDDYQKIVQATKIYPADAVYTYAALGLASEAGEVAGKIKKYVRGDYPTIEPIRDKIIDELGDVLWYVTALAIELNTTLDEIQKRNKEKLIARLEKNTIKGEGDNR
jgi:NTP pyrophosphatase (non-canonical NTP hydrolase)